MTIADWVRSHPFLEPIALVSGQIDAAIEAAAIRSVPPPDWNDYGSEFLAGVPLLHSIDAALDLDAAGRPMVTVFESLARSPLDDALLSLIHI